MVWLLSLLSAIGLAFSYVSDWPLSWIFSWISLGLHFYLLNTTDTFLAFRSTLLIFSIWHSVLLWDTRQVAPDGIESFWIWNLSLSLIYVLYSIFYVALIDVKNGRLYQILVWIVKSIIWSKFFPAMSLLVTQSSSNFALFVASYIGPLGILLLLWFIGHGVFYALSIVRQYVNGQAQVMDLLRVAGVCFVLLLLAVFSSTPNSLDGDRILLQIVPYPSIHTLELKNEYYVSSLGFLREDAEYIVFPYEKDVFASGYFNNIQYVTPEITQQNIVSSETWFGPYVQIVDNQGVPHATYGNRRYAGWHVWYTEKGNVKALEKYAKMLSSSYAKPIIMLPEGDNAIIIEGSWVTRLEAVFFSQPQLYSLITNHKLTPYLLLSGMFG